MSLFLHAPARILVALVCCLILGNAALGEERVVLRFPKSISRFEIATREDLFYSQLLKNLVNGDKPSDWKVLSGMTGQLGSWVGSYLDAQKIATNITAGMPIEGQPPVRSVDLIVADCAKILGVPKPLVYFRNSPCTTAYVGQIGEKPVLVLTSGLLQLFEGKSDELRFIIGHELGHLKCEHLQIKGAAYGILTAVNSINLAVVPDKFQLVLPTLALGRLFTWARESEISADRAGLLCCQDPEVAYQALLRLLHGIGSKSSWIDPHAADFDAERVVREFERWQDKPFVEFVMHLKNSDSQVPFIPERLAALKLWSDTKAHVAILRRAETEVGSEMIVLKRIGIAGVARADSPVNPYIVGYRDDEKFGSSGKCIPTVEKSRTCCSG